MAEANAAYAARDTTTLRALLEGNEPVEVGRPDSDRDLLDRVAAAWRELDDSEQALLVRHQSEDGLLMVEAEYRNRRGKDLLAETRTNLASQRKLLVEQLAAMSSTP